MDRRSFLAGLATAVTVAAIPMALKTEALASTSISRLMNRRFHIRYDSVAMSYVKDVLGRTTLLPGDKVVDGNIIKLEAGFGFTRQLVPPDPVRAAYLLEAERKDRAYGNSGWMPAGYDPDLS